MVRRFLDACRRNWALSAAVGLWVWTPYETSSRKIIVTVSSLLGTITLVAIIVSLPASPYWRMDGFARAVFEIRSGTTRKAERWRWTVAPIIYTTSDYGDPLG